MWGPVNETNLIMPSIWIYNREKKAPVAEYLTCELFTQ